MSAGAKVASNTIKKSVDKADKSYSAGVLRTKIIRYIICILLCILSIMPFYIMLVNSTRASAAIQAGISLIPSDQLAENYTKLMDKANSLGTPVLKAMINSIVIAAPATIFSVYFSTLTAYGIYVYRFKLRNFVWSFILAIMMIPAQVSIIGFYKFMIQLNLNDTYIPLILPAIAAPSTVFFMRQYMKTALPLAIIDAARIDGSAEFMTFNTIAVPLMKPAIATQAIFVFITSWNNLFTPSMILSSTTKYTLPMFVQLLRSEQFRSDYGIIYLGLLVTVLPLIVVYLILSKYIIAGVALGGVKE